MRPTGLAFMTAPPMNQHVCSACSFTATSRDVFPKLEYEAMAVELACPFCGKVPRCEPVETTMDAECGYPQCRSFTISCQVAR